MHAKALLALHRATQRHVHLSSFATDDSAYGRGVQKIMLMHAESWLELKESLAAFVDGGKPLPTDSWYCKGFFDNSDT